MKVREGECIVLCGINGCDKTTFAHCLCGLMKHKGTIMQDGEKEAHPMALSGRQK